MNFLIHGAPNAHKLLKTFISDNLPYSCLQNVTESISLISSAFVSVDVFRKLITTAVSKFIVKRLYSNKYLRYLLKASVNSMNNIFNNYFMSFQIPCVVVNIRNSLLCMYRAFYILQSIFYALYVYVDMCLNN